MNNIHNNKTKPEENNKTNTNQCSTYVEPITDPTNQYIWGGEVRDRRDRSMCARPYFNYYRR